MSLASRLITAALGLALIWYLWPFGGGDSEVVQTVTPPPTGHERLFTTKLPEPTPATTPPTAPSKPPPKTGDQTAAVAPAAKPKVTAKRYYRVTVRDGGTLESGNIVIRLHGIEANAADATCKDSTGKTWRCGTRARAALTRFIRGRAVVCTESTAEDPKAPADGTALTARCTLARKDLSTWMVAHGWAKPAAPAEPKLTKAADEARKRKIGIWR